MGMIRFFALIAAALLLTVSCMEATGESVRESGDTTSQEWHGDNGGGTSSVLIASSSSSEYIEVGDSPVWGPNTAKITIVEFGDFQCPYCASAAAKVKTLQARYPTQIRFIYKHFPLSFHQNARPAAYASIAAQKQGKFWEFYSLIDGYYSQLSEEVYLQIASELKLDIAKFKVDMQENEENLARIQAEIDLGDSLQVSGTPSFFVNGVRDGNFSVESVEAKLNK